MITNYCEPILINELVPNAGNYAVKMGRKSLQVLVKKHIGVIGLTIVAISAFLQGNLPDPLVGENACQIRAAYYSAQAGDEKTLCALSEVCSKLENLISRISEVKLPEGKDTASWDEITEENSLDQKIPSVVAPIVYGHILTISKRSDLSINKKEVSLVEANDPKKLSGVTSTAAKEWIKHARKSLSAKSVQYLQQEANRLNIKGPDGILTDSLGLQTAPGLQGMKILLAGMKANGTMIALKNRMMDEEGKERGRVSLLYAPSGKERSYQVMIVPQQEDPNRPGMIIEAVSISSKERTPEKLKAELIEVGFEPILYANFAAHPQYGGGCKEVEPASDEDLEKWRAIARERGLCAENPDLCRIYHIYAARIGSAL